MWVPLLIRGVSTQPAQPVVSGYKRRCTSSQYPEQGPGLVWHFSQGPQIASDVRTSDMPSASCRGPRSGVPLRPHRLLSIFFSPIFVGSLVERASVGGSKWTIRPCDRFTATVAFAHERGQL